MPEAYALTLTIDPDLLARFDAAAGNRELSAQALLLELIRNYVDEFEGYRDPGYDDFVRRKVEAARASIKAGRLVPSEVVEAEFAALRASMKDEGE